MQFAHLPVHIGAVVVINAVGAFAVLLYLGQQYAFADGMHTPGGDEEHIARLGIFEVQDALQMSGFEELTVLIGCHLLLKTVHNGCPFVGFEDIPHLGLSILHAALLRQFVVGVHLYREPVVGVDNLHQQREIDAEMVKVLLTDELAQAKDILFYRDDTILVILWKEQIDGNSVTFTEVKIADGSQLRRKFTEDTFGSYNSDYASQLAASVNAVVAMNADYYLFRDFGMVAYNRELFRFNTGGYDANYNKYNCVDTLFVTAGGDFLYKRLGEQNTWDSIQQFIWDNDVVFSVAFGPVLVENGQALPCDWYPVGEVNSGYSRAGIGQVDKLHYLYLSLNHSNEKEARWTVSTFAQHFAEQGVQTAYCLDGGQTGEVVFRGEPYNHIDFGSERLVSDILYFATALPEEGGSTP